MRAQVQNGTMVLVSKMILKGFDLWILKIITNSFVVETTSKQPFFICQLGYQLGLHKYINIAVPMVCTLVFHLKRTKDGGYTKFRTSSKEIFS